MQVLKNQIFKYENAEICADRDGGANHRMYV
ncbi:MAG: hypothetical protein H6Q20_474 [Bacteroidetes bacterium]|nr:hypothetical protein [Bacteroidota bacterium]